MTAEPSRRAVPAGRDDPDDLERLILARCEAPVLDVGCGPGRLVAALNARGVPALGIDVSRQAVEQTRRRGAMALRRAVEDPVPAEGRWGTVLLADGSIGIGGDPGALLRRCRLLVGPRGLVLVETDDAVGPRTVAALAPTCGFAVLEEWRLHRRTVVALRAVG